MGNDDEFGCVSRRELKSPICICRYARNAAELTDLEFAGLSHHHPFIPSADGQGGATSRISGRREDDTGRERRFPQFKANLDFTSACDLVGHSFRPVAVRLSFEHVAHRS
jgi:hypothetical protein